MKGKVTQKRVYWKLAEKWGIASKNREKKKKYLKCEMYAIPPSSKMSIISKK